MLLTQQRHSAPLRPGTVHTATARRCSFPSSRRVVLASAAGQKKIKIWTRGDWAAENCDLINKKLSPDMRDTLVTYGELVQAAYDNLGLDRCDSNRYGNCLAADPEQLLAYTQGNYSVAEGKPAPAKSTFDRYKLPAASKQLSPLICALPGKACEGDPARQADTVNQLTKVSAALANKYFTTVPGLLVSFIDGNNGGLRLFSTNPDGRGSKPRGTFFGYVAVSSTPDKNGQHDVALVWRGTIFREEWESNFAQDQLTTWGPVSDDRGPNSRQLNNPLPTADQVGVHAGFEDLYNRDIWNKDSNGNDTLDQPSPRKVVHEWLRSLMKDYNVGSITTTGHSLGGGLATLCAFDVAEFMQEVWKDSDDGPGSSSSPSGTSDDADKASWATKAAPQVRMVGFAAPRVGNVTFVDKFHDMGVQALRINNKGDIVPDVPGLVVQALTSGLERVSTEAAVDTTDPAAGAWRWIYKAASQVSDKVGWASRWGYFHVGQVLELDCDWAEAATAVNGSTHQQQQPAEKVLEADSFFRKHNLELYLYLLSLLGEDGPGNKTNRNPLLVNKSDDILANKQYPADWWRVKDKRGCKLVGGHWVYALRKP